MKINKKNSALFISTICAFTLNMAMEAPEKETISLEMVLNNQPSLANMPNEIKVKIINDIVNNIIENNKKLSTIDVIKLIAKELLPLRQIDREFNELINDYISCHYGLSRALESNGIDVNQKDTSGNTALVSTIREHKPELAKLIIKLRTDVNAVGHTRVTPLLWAAVRGYEDLVNLLIDLGADVNAKAFNGETALTEAAHENNINIVNLLINSGANVNDKDNYGNTPLINAAYHGHTAIVNLLIRRSRVNNIIDAIDNSLGYTALMCAVEQRHKDTALLLISLGANTSIQTKYGYTALDIATRRGYEDIIALLLKP